MEVGSEPLQNIPKHDKDMAIGLVGLRFAGRPLHSMGVEDRARCGHSSLREAGKLGGAKLGTQGVHRAQRRPRAGGRGDLRG